MGWAWSCCGFQVLLVICYLFQSSKKMPLIHYSCHLGSLGHDRAPFPGSLLFGQSSCILSLTVSCHVTMRTSTSMVL